MLSCEMCSCTFNERTNMLKAGEKTLIETGRNISKYLHQKELSFAQTFIIVNLVLFESICTRSRHS